MSTARKKEHAKPTTHRYASVEDMMRAEGVSAEVQQGVAELAAETKICERLAVMRTAAGLTQEQMAEQLGVSQGCISKWESGRDEDLTPKVMDGYARATNQWITMTYGRDMTDAEAVKYHAINMKQRLTNLARLAHKGAELEAGIQRFFAEAFFNLFDIISSSQSEMPHSEKMQMKLTVMEASRSLAREEQGAAIALIETRTSGKTGAKRKLAVA